MTFLRILLFAGLVFHKALWEFMKRRHGLVGSQRTPWKLNIKSVVKLLKSLALVFLVVQTLFLDLLPILESARPLRVLGTLIFFSGLAIAVMGRVRLGENWANLEDYQVIPEQKLVQSGIYRFIRHPIYTGDVLLILGLELALNSWLVLILIPLSLAVVRQTRAEEAILSQAFPNYQVYRQRTKMFIPFVI